MKQISGYIKNRISMTNNKKVSSINKTHKNNYTFTWRSRIYHLQEQ